MKCINKKRRRRKKRKTGLFLVVILFIGILLGGFLWKQKQVEVAAYESNQYSSSIYQASLKVDELCVTSDNISSDKFQTEDEFHAIALFQIDNAEVKYAKDIHEKLYPASTTKILTVYLALKYGNLEDTVTVSENAVGVPLDSSRAGLRTGDQLTLEALLYSLMLPSGNDSAVAIAEHISGSVEDFIKLMNTEAVKLGATNSNFINPHGYHDENHYTTAYDLYLIFNECVKYDKFNEIVSSSEYHTKITQKNGTYREVTWKQSNQYVNGSHEIPKNVSVIGGKTGTTDEAGACLILYSKKNDSPYISIIMGADSKAILYDNMSELISSSSVSE